VGGLILFVTVTKQLFNFRLIKKLSKTHILTVFVERVSRGTWLQPTLFTNLFSYWQSMFWSRNLCL